MKQDDDWRQKQREARAAEIRDAVVKVYGKKDFVLVVNHVDDAGPDGFGSVIVSSNVELAPRLLQMGLEALPQMKFHSRPH